jgi:glycosyltransferase involved in cell wall biosynthesis
MRVAVVHYHLRRGGVTRVIENAVAALEPHGVEVLALAGEPYMGDALPKHAVVEGLGYRDVGSSAEGRKLGEAMETTATAHFGVLPDVWHIHNHSLGKNSNLVGALHYLLDRGATVLLQIHDFAEDGRPGNYARLRRDLGNEFLDEKLYPVSPRLHYAVLNGRDHAILARAGIPGEQLHLLPNAVAVPHLGDTIDTPLDLPDHDRLILYPTRAIRRKNLGELLLHAALSDRGTHFATTLRPQNPEWQTIHGAWEKFAREQSLPVSFGLGEKHAFPALICAADALATTSVAEGFGLAFLEPYLFGKPVVGRDLPEITADFQAAGVDLSQLYPTLPVPIPWIDQKVLREKVRRALESSFTAYAAPLPEDAAEVALVHLTTGGFIDFGVLDEPLQKQVIERAIADPGALPKNVPGALKWHSKGIDQNAAKIRQTYSLNRYGERLTRLFERMAENQKLHPKIGYIHANRVLNAFLEPARVNLLRS